MRKNSFHEKFLSVYHICPVIPAPPPGRAVERGVEWQYWYQQDLETGYKKTP